MVEYSFNREEPGNMEKAKIAIVGNVCCGLGFYLFNRTASAFSDDFECFRQDFHQEFPEDVPAWAAERGVRGVVIGGSLKSPLNDDPWIRDEESFIRGLVAAGVPTLGICFGHEILASAMGAELVKAKRMHFALEHIEPLADDPLFRGVESGFKSLFSHSVSVARLPLGFVQIARANKCEFAAMRHESLHIYGVQFHPEMDVEIKEHDPIWRMLKDADILGNEGRVVLENFRDIVKAHADVTAKG
jgi:GMP synthase (glutamine-hydrolysing)